MTTQKTKFLFLLKKSSAGYGNEYNPHNHFSGKAGLQNSATFVADAISKWLNIESKVEVCVDGNSIDREVTLFRPQVCFIEAIWVTPAKFEELVKRHPKVLFIVRVHSRIPFLANEGIAIQWIKAYDKIKNVFVSFNHKETNQEFNLIGVRSVYLPNIYDLDTPTSKQTFLESLIEMFFEKRDCDEDNAVVNIGCFGAIRPMKNQLLQAVAALIYAEKYNKTIRFHINASRTEQKGENVLKNLRALFEGTRHELVEYTWMEHAEFEEIIRTMDIGLQVSLSESFNIVTADFVSEKIPIVVSKEIDWMFEHSKVSTSSAEEIADKIKECLDIPKTFAHKNMKSLEAYNEGAIKTWGHFITTFEKLHC